MNRLWRDWALAAIAMAWAAQVDASAFETAGLRLVAHGVLVASAVEPDSAAADTLWSPVEAAEAVHERETWLRAPFGDQLLTDADQWEATHDRNARLNATLDYNRVDPLRVGLAYQAQLPATMYPRLGARLEYAFGRERVLYGVQVEQPLFTRRIAVGVAMMRRTDHSDLQQVEDVENSLAMIFGRQDYRDYFEREGFGAYIAWRVPDFSTVTLHLRSDDFRSLERHTGARSLLRREREWRENPAVDEGEAHAALLRLERLAHRTRRTRAGFYHWVELERAGQQLGGDFEYTRALADMRSVLRLSPATTLSLRVVGGHTLQGVLPFQKHFTTGGVDGLRARPFASERGNQMFLVQAEYSIGLWRLRASSFEGGLHAIVFLDAGRAWFHPGHGWDLGRQPVRADGGFGLGTSEDNLRIYFAKNLQEPDSDFVVSLRLQRPF